MSDLTGAMGGAADGLGNMLDRFDTFGVTTASFVFMIDGRPIGSFQSLEGMEVEVEQYTFDEGGNNHSQIKRPGKMVWSNLVLKRGISMVDTLWDWINATSGQGFAANASSMTDTALGLGTHAGKNKFDAQTGALILMSPLGVPLRSWWVYEALPVKWTGPNFNAAAITEGETVPMELLEISHQGLKRADLI